MNTDSGHGTRCDLKIDALSLGPLATNCYIVSDGIRTIVIDPAEDAEALRVSLAGKKVDGIINTHGHFDHVGGNWAIDPSGTRIFIHPADIPWVDEAYPGHPPFVHHLKEGDTPIPSLEVLHLPGHSLGSVALVGGGAIFCGDVLFAGSVGVGIYEAQWNGRDRQGRTVASGAYFCKLQIEQWTTAKRLIFVR